MNVLTDSSSSLHQADIDGESLNTFLMYMKSMAQPTKLIRMIIKKKTPQNSMKITPAT